MKVHDSDMKSDAIEAMDDYADGENAQLPEDSRVFQYNIDTYTNAIPVERLVDDFRTGIIRVPDFQRPYVWQKRDDKTERHRPSLFIDSILQGLPTPPISIYKDATAREEGLLIDGQQRIKTLAWFMTQELENKKKIFKLHGEGVSPEWLGKDFESLGKKIGGFLKRAYIPVTYIRQLNEEKPPLPKASSLYVLFDRLNSGGYSLAPHEKRSVLIIYNESSKIFRKFLDDVYGMEGWGTIFPFFNANSDSYKITQFKELIFRVYAFYLYRDNYKGNMAKFLDDFILNYIITQKKSDMLIRWTNDALSLLCSLSERKGKLFYPQGRFNTAFYECFLVSIFTMYEKKIPLNIKKLSDVYDRVNIKKLYYGKDSDSKLSNVAKGVIETRFDNVYKEFLEGK